MNINSHILQETPSLSYEQVVQDIAFKKPKELKTKSIQGIYYKSDPACQIELQNGNIITLRIWAKHMNNNLSLKDEGNVFISAYVSVGEGIKSHLGLYGWYQHDDYDGVWEKILKA